MLTSNLCVQSLLIHNAYNNVGNYFEAFVRFTYLLCFCVVFIF